MTEEQELRMGAVPGEGAVTFRVWAPNAEKVSVVGSFNEWDPEAHPMERDERGVWHAEVAEAKVGDEYRYLLVKGDQTLSRIDPYARQVTSSVGNGVVHDPAFDWGDDAFEMPPWHELVIYELHPGTFGAAEGEVPATFEDAIGRLDHLRRLGVNAVQIMPAAEFAGDVSWGYNPAHIFAVESAYGGPAALKEFVKQAHAQGFAVILDVVYNHLGPSDLSLWKFDGWGEGDCGGIYFYNDARAQTLWGDTRPDYGRPEVRRFLRDNALMWLEDYHIDGLRWDGTLYIRTVHGRRDAPADELPDGWGLMREINAEIRRRFPRRLCIAEDLQDNEWLTRDVAAGGAGFGAQWDARFVHPVRAAVIGAEDAGRRMETIREALAHAYNGEPFQRVIYSESHDEVASGKARVPYEISPDEPDSWFAQKRSTLAAALVFTAPGIPMLFQGQEFLQGEWFRDDAPLDWDQSEEFRGIVLLYRDLIHWRLNCAGATRGLCGHHLAVHHVNESEKVIAFHRWEEGGPGDDVVVVANFANQAYDAYEIGVPRDGEWKVRLNSDWTGYSPDFGGLPSSDTTAIPGERDGLACHATVGLPPYSVILLSQDP
ncbi:MAG: alpha-amylase family glycosyl hydrolase [Planctomycetota bacterium]